MQIFALLRYYRNWLDFSSCSFIQYLILWFLLTKTQMNAEVTLNVWNLKLLHNILEHVQCWGLKRFSTDIHFVSIDRTILTPDVNLFDFCSTTKQTYVQSIQILRCRQHMTNLKICLVCSFYSTALYGYFLESQKLPSFRSVYQRKGTQKNSIALPFWLTTQTWQVINHMQFLTTPITYYFWYYICCNSPRITTITNLFTFP